MKLHSVHCGNFKLDGGAMFGVVPKSMWQKLNPADENNMCSWAMRSLLIEDGNRLILVDTGMGNKQDAKFFGHYYLHGNENLESSLQKLGFHKSDITDVLLTHLHFDHCGGAIMIENEKFVPSFPNAKYWSNQNHWKWATEPNAREKASFLKDNILPIAASGQLNFIENQPETNAALTKSHWIQDIDMIFTNGHTEAMMLPKIQYKGKNIVYMADLLPSVGHIPIPYVMAYDTRPLLTLEEKKSFLQEACDNEYILFFEHDPVQECCTLQETEKGIRAKDLFLLSEV